MLYVELWVAALLSVFDSFSLAVWFKVALRLDELVLLLVSFVEVVSSYWLFAPRL